MKKIFLLISLLFVAVTVNAEMQQGYTKTRGKLDAKGQLIPGQRLSGVIVETDRGKVTSEKDGAFSLAIPNGKFVLKKVDLSGYILNDFEQLRQYSCSATPLALVLIHPDEYSSEKVYAQKKIIRTLRRTLQEREDEIDSLFEQQKISEQEKNALYQKLYADEQNSQKLVEEMAERYAKTDFDQIDEFQRQVTNLIINGELEKADSLLNTKGNIEEQIRENQQLDEANRREREELSQREDNLTKSEAFSTKTKEDLAARCYSKYEIYATKHKNDSAAYYLELRASIDTTNVEWNIDAGSYLENYLANFNKAREYYQCALRNSKDDYQKANCLNQIASICTDLGEFDDAIELFEKAKNIIVTTYGEKCDEVATTYNNLGYILAFQGKLEESLQYFMKSLNIRLEIEENSERVALCYGNLANYYENIRDYDKFLEYSQKALDIFRNLYGENNLNVAVAYEQIGLYYQHISEFDKSLEYFGKSLDIENLLLEENHPKIASAYNSIACTYYYMGDLEKAFEYFKKSILIYKNTVGVNSPRVSVLCQNLGFIYKKVGDYEKSIDYYTEALNITLNIFGEQHPDVADIYKQIAFVYVKQEDYNNALVYFIKLLDIEKSKGEQTLGLSEAYNNLYHAYTALGDTTKAEEYKKKAEEIKAALEQK